MASPPKMSAEQAAAALATVSGADIDSLLARMKFNGWSKYVPHCGKRQQARYLRQIRNGTLKGVSVSDDARLAALDLVR